MIPPLLLWCICWLLLLAGQPAQAQPPSNLPAADSVRSAWQAQLLASCKAMQTYEKQVTKDGQKETKQYKPGNCQPAADAEAAPSLPLTHPAAPALALQKELELALDQLVLTERLQERFSIRQNGDTLTAKPLPQARKDVEVQYQQLVWRDGHLAYVHTKVLRDNWLYETDLSIRVFFDAQGRYSKHALTLSTGIPLLGSAFQAQITGQASYPAAN